MLRCLEKALSCSAPRRILLAAIIGPGTFTVRLSNQPHSSQPFKNFGTLTIIKATFSDEKP